MNKQEIAQILKDIGLLLELIEDQPFKSRAYYNGARIVELVEEDLQELVAENKLVKLRGIGKALAEKITELVVTGKSSYYEELKAQIPSGVLDLLRVPGLGPKKVRVLYQELQITNLRQLEYACKENRLVTLPGFGEKTQEKVLKGIDFLKTFQGHYYYAEAYSLALEVLELLRDNPGVEKADLAGSLRRSKEIVKDLDFVACGNNPGQIIADFCREPRIREVIAQGESKASVLWDTGIQIDLRAVEPSLYPFVLHHFTGSKEHNTALRHLAKSRGYKLNEYGLFSGEERVSCASETELFRALDLNYIPPELRENRGEIEAAEQGPLPNLVEVKDIQGVFHVHSLYSDGKNSLEELIVETIRKGYSYLGISDHSQSAFYARGLKAADISRQQEEIEKLREKYPQIKIFAGIEADIKPDGALDYPDDILQSFDFVIASVHSHFKMTEEAMTARIVKAMSHPAVTMLGHPTGRILLAREGYPVNMAQVLETAKENQVIMELNASPARLDLDWRYLKEAKERGILISINPDAHRLEELDDIKYGVAVARKGWLTKEDVFNCYSATQADKYLKDKK